MVLVIVLKFVYGIIKELYYLSFISARIHFILRRNHPYYSHLRNQREFARACWEFILNNNFIAREGLNVTFSLKLLIASHAVQLSWRLSDRAYDYYEKILLYKEYYLSRLTHKKHKAEVNPGMRLIVFSARAIHESVTRQKTGVNVLLHEFAHALWLEQQLMHEHYHIFDPMTFENVNTRIDHELQIATEQEGHLFRSYAFTNKAEFFAVAVENFFERPKSFQQQLPELYQLLTSLFRQDPANMYRDKIIKN